MAPSKLITTTAQYLGQMGRVRAQAVAAAAAVTNLQTLTVRGPFNGLTPDIDPNLLDGTSFKSMMNCLARAHGEDHGEVLGLPDGIRQIDSDDLPLGDGSTIPASPTTDGTAIVRLDQILRYAPTGHATPGELTGEFQLTPMAVSAGDGSTAGSGNMYRINSSGAWTHVAAATSMSATTRQLSADRDGRSASQSMPDSCVAPFGATSRAANTVGGDDLQSGPITEPCWVFTNDVDEVMVFPSHSDAVDGTRAGNHWYEPLCDDTSSSDLDAGGANGFKAKSCETWNGRVYFLNTEEAGTRYSQRLRRTAKFTADPLTTNVGAGYRDFREFAGEGLRCEKLGEVLVAYFTDGVAFVQETGVSTSPDDPQIVSTERGLLATHAVTPIGRNTHFGIFTDGWWLLDSSGRWQEVGLANINNRLVPKWRETFYEKLDEGNRHRLYVYYDQPQNLVKIAIPTDDASDPEEVWIWDPTSDRISGVENYPVTCFGTYQPAQQSGTQINSAVGSIDTNVAAIDSFGVISGYPKVCVHGDLTGYVYTHRRNVEGFDSAASPPTVQDPQWSFATGLRSPAGMRNLTTVDRVSLEYFNHQNEANVSVEARGVAAEGVQTESVKLNQGAHEDVQVRDAWFRFTSRNPGLTISGTGEYHIRALEIDVFTDPVEPRR